jgi:hypothetical protein
VDVSAGRKMRLGNIELCSKGDSIPALREDCIHVTTLNVSPISVELCSERDGIPASAKVGDPPMKLRVMPIKIDSEKMVAPSKNEYRMFKFIPAIRMGVNVTLKSSVFEDLLLFVCKTFGSYVVPPTYLKPCFLISLRRPLAFKGGG